ncbi:hypothetical protein Trydic_g20759 [Trypoxylus dichotomus]
MVHRLYTRVIIPTIIHPTLVWWCKFNQRYADKILGEVQVLDHGLDANGYDGDYSRASAAAASAELQRELNVMVYSVQMFKKSVQFMSSVWPNDKRVIHVPPPTHRFVHRCFDS